MARQTTYGGLTNYLWCSVLKPDTKGQALDLNHSQANRLQWFDTQARYLGQDQVSILTTS